MGPMGVHDHESTSHESRLDEFHSLESRSSAKWIAWQVEHGYRIGLKENVPAEPDTCSANTAVSDKHIERIKATGRFCVWSLRIESYQRGRTVVADAKQAITFDTWSSNDSKHASHNGADVADVDPCPSLSC